MGTYRYTFVQTPRTRGTKSEASRRLRTSVMARGGSLIVTHAPSGGDADGGEAGGWGGMGRQEALGESLHWCSSLL